MNDRLIEIRIKKRNATYLATCDEFPNCRGIGSTKQQALSKLADSISSLVGRVMKDSLNSIFSSENYTRVVIDATNESNETTFAYSLPKCDQLLSRLFLFKVFHSELESEDAFDNPDSDALMNVFSQTKIGSDPKVSSHIYDQLLIKNSADSNDQADDAYLFGFPLNFN